MRPRVSWCEIGSRARPTIFENGPSSSVMVWGESSAGGAVVTYAVYRRVWRPIITAIVGVINSSRMWC